ncbi:5-formyltetrahydrofolate cyclo-ligase [Dyadobacter chenhuakuii]|uniref:5-formyltetrahydrofolate cyclo-ligase n=1 Tax=Dyadobacter chenhuakuii TaxID=2909339 RepID=A0ABY4XHL3_9BACT|nr:5-formyltetrahydrofolate cyclo-ligase [Dyadobacter chenhuakuii]MCF2495847.1 5-formyltetrahydrofolate cyclo-ligase [Dyadobacter chenhuakuii]USJ29920.1 5-formyltetrahydrofolate cyclo-ligase [Dyadobacter chenhuakuii]
MMDKAALRKDFLSKRMSLTEDDILVKNNLICQNLFAALTLQGPETIHLFLPQIIKNEINTWQIVNQLQASFSQIRIVAPYVIPGTKEMEHYLLDKNTKLITNPWGIPEPDPATSIRVNAEEIDRVYIPLLAFDERGYRVGYGGGYYDRFLAKCRPDIVKTGLSFFEPVSKIDDIDPYDMPMNASITPEKIWTW